MNSKTKGILCIVTAAFCFAFMSLCVRLAGDLPSMQKILFRNLLAFFIVGAGLVRKPEKLEIHKGDLKFLFLRSICGTVGIVCNFYAIDHLVLVSFLHHYFFLFSFKRKTDPVSGNCSCSSIYGSIIYHQTYRKYDRSGSAYWNAGGCGSRCSL